MLLMLIRIYPQRLQLTIVHSSHIHTNIFTGTPQLGGRVDENLFEDMCRKSAADVSVKAGGRETLSPGHMDTQYMSSLLVSAELESL